MNSVLGNESEISAAEALKPLVSEIGNLYTFVDVGFGGDVVCKEDAERR